MNLVHTLAAKGWKPLPLPPGQKQSPPAGFTGYHGRQPTDNELDTWASQHDNGLIDLAIGLPFDTIGIDVDHYDDKTGGTTLRQLETELGPLPPAHKIGSRPGISGIRLYRAPVTENGEPLAFKANAGPHIDIIRPVHRYIKYAGTHPTKAARPS